MRFIGDPEELVSTFSALLNGADRVDVVVAWAGLNDILRLLTEFIAKGGGLRFVVGRDFARTDPRAVRRILDLRADACRWGFKPRLGVFHPKTYVFHRPERVDVLVGSANLTEFAFTQNVEAVVHIGGSLQSMSDVLGFVENAWSAGEEVTSQSLDAYVEEWRAIRSEEIDAEAARIAGSEVSPIRAEAAAEADRVGRGLLSWNWDQFYDKIKRFDELWRPFGHHGLAEMIDMLDEVPALLDRPIGRLSRQGRLALLGEFTDAFPNAPILGRMSAAGTARHRLVEDDPPSRAAQEAMTTALRGIPKHGPPELRSIDSVYSDIRKIDGVGHAIATRYLTLRRPDLFFSVNSASLETLARLLDVPASRLTAWEGYVQGLRHVWGSPWHRAAEPRDALETKVWRYRVAILDMFAYRPTSGLHPAEELE